MRPQKRVLPILFVTLLLDMTGIGMVFPIIPILFTDPSSPSFLLTGHSVGSQYFLAGLLTALFGLMQFIAAPLLGELSDAYGRKRLLTVGVAVLAVSQLIFGFGITVKSLLLIFGSRLIAGVAAANFSIAQASIADVTEPKDRAKNFGLIGAAFGIGFIVGPLLSGWITHLSGNAASPFWLAGILGIINLFFITLFLPETRRTNAETRHSFHILKGIHNIRAALRDVDARPVYIGSFSYQLGFAFFTSFIGILLVGKFGFSSASIGTFFGIVGAWIVFTQMVILRILSRKYGERAILRNSLIMLGLGILSYPFLPSVAFLYGVIPFVAVANGLSIANMGALISKSVSPEKQGAALGINGSLQALSQGIAPLVAGVGSSFLGIQTPFIIGALLILFAWVVLFRLFRPR